MWQSKPILILFQQKNTETVDKTEKSQTSKKTVPNSQKTDTLNSIDKSRSTPRTNLSNKGTKIENPTEIDILKDNENVSLLSEQVHDLESVTPDNVCIPCKNKIKKTPDTSVKRKEPIVEPVNPSKISKYDTVTDV